MPSDYFTGAEFQAAQAAGASAKESTAACIFSRAAYRAVAWLFRCFFSRSFHWQVFT